MTERSFHPNNIISVKKLHLQKMNNQKLYCETIEQLVYQKLKQYCVGSNPFILLCVSGGSDSMAMLHIMHSLQKLYMPQLSLQVINFNHKLRIESDEEVVLRIFVALTSSFNCIEYSTKPRLTLLETGQIRTRWPTIQE